MSYLEDNLLPLVLDIKTPKTDSYIMIAAGLGDKTSQSSILIQMGYKLEDFWNKVISDCATNLIEDNNKIKVNGKNRQLDHVIKLIDKIIYLRVSATSILTLRRNLLATIKLRQFAILLVKHMVKKSLLVTSCLASATFLLMCGKSIPT